MIKEVKEGLSIKKSEKIAYDYLTKISLEHIAQLRKPQCSNIELFYVMLIRALMNNEKNIVIPYPISLIENFNDIEIIIENITKLNNDKTITILDTITNEIHYKGCLCHIIK